MQQADPGFDHLRRPFVGARYERRVSGHIVKVIANKVMFLGVPYVEVEKPWGNPAASAHFDVEDFYRTFRAVDNVTPLNVLSTVQRI